MAPRLDVVEKLNDRNISIDGKAENSRFVVPNTYQGTLTLRIIGMQTRNRPARGKSLLESLVTTFLPD